MCRRAVGVLGARGVGVAEGLAAQLAAPRPQDAVGDERACVDMLGCEHRQDQRNGASVSLPSIAADRFR